MNKTADSIRTVLDDILRAQEIVSAFSGFIVHNEELEEFNKRQFHDDMARVFNGLAPEQVERALQILYNEASTASFSHLQLLLEILEKLIQSNTLTPRVVCESLINSPKLIFSNQDFWLQSFKFLNKLIESVEYKGVREIMKGCLEKAKTMPANVTIADLDQLDTLVNFVTRITSRDACLIPAYLLANELQKGYPESPHWRLTTLIHDFVGSFRNCTQMVSIIGHHEMRPIVEHSGMPEHLIGPWKLDPMTLKFNLKGTLPYNKQVLDKQTALLKYVLDQPYSRDMVCGMLGLQKQQKMHCPPVEEQIVELMILAVERTEAEPDENLRQDFWIHLSSKLIYFVLFQFANFPEILKSLIKRIEGHEYKIGRHYLMWILLQFISGSIQRNPISNFFPVFKLYELLFPEQTPPFAVPNFHQSGCTREMAMACIWIHMVRKAGVEKVKINWKPTPRLLFDQENLQRLVVPILGCTLSLEEGYPLVLLCNAYSTNQDAFTKPMATMVDFIQGCTKMTTPPTEPLSMVILDSLTIHSKMSLIHSIVTHVIKLSQSKTSHPLAPALVETYSRLLVYTEIESLGIKGFISQLLPTVYKSHAWATLYTLLEMFSYRMHHIHPHYRVQLLSHLHSLAAVPQANQTQLHLCVESTALRLITGLGSWEVQPELARFLQEPKTLVSSESEELNRALVLTIARATHVTGADGSWSHELLTSIMQNTPHSWAPHTLECFPAALTEFFTQHSVPKENKQQLKKAVEEEYRKWASMNNENDIMAHFGVAGAPPLFLCLLWKMLLETDHISPIAYKILERIGARALSAHLRKFCDCLVYEFSNSPGGQHVNKCVDTINDMIWKYNIVTIDRMVLCLALRTQEGSEAQVCSFIIQLVLLKAAEFRTRVAEFVKDNSPDHWNQSNWHEKHIEFHQKYPEKFAPEEQSSTYKPYFGNVGLRFLPVFDIVVHRFLEIPQVTKSLEILLEHLGCLYKFHDRPVTYLYNTLHYYETRLRDRPLLKRRLVAAILANVKDYLTEPYQQYLTHATEDIWVPELDYYMKLVKRFVDTLSSKLSNVHKIDWRFNEFPNSGVHILYTTCVELMGLPVGPAAVANGLMDVILRGYTAIPKDAMHQWINAVGLIISALPPSYWSVLQDRLLATISEMERWNYDCTIFRLLNFTEVHNGFLFNRFCYMLAVTHSVWHHAGPGQITSIPKWMKEKLPEVVHNEEQYIFVCHLVGPFLQRFNVAVVELTATLYELLAQVDQTQPQLKYMDSICDLLYHIKYMFVGDSMKRNLEAIVKKLKPALQLRLRFITHLTVEEINAS